MDSNICAVPEIFSLMSQILETFILHSSVSVSQPTSVLLLKQHTLPTHWNFFSGPKLGGKLFVTLSQLGLFKSNSRGECL